MPVGQCSLLKRTCSHDHMYVAIDPYVVVGATTCPLGICDSPPQSIAELRMTV